MSNAIYPKFKEKMLKAQVDLSTRVIKAVLVKNTYAPVFSTNEFLSDIQAHVTNTPQQLSGVTVTNGVFDANDVTFPAVAADTHKAIVLYIDTGVPATSPLMMYFDDIPGFPFTGNGADAEIRWSSSDTRIFSL